MQLPHAHAASSVLIGAAGDGESGISAPESGGGGGDACPADFESDGATMAVSLTFQFQIGFKTDL